MRIESSSPELVRYLLYGPNGEKTMDLLFQQILVRKVPVEGLGGWVVAGRERKWMVKPNDMISKTQLLDVMVAHWR